MTHLTESQEQWAAWELASLAEVAELQGNPLTPDRAERMANEIHERWASATRYDPTADFDPDIDPGHFDPEAADREAAREVWERMGGDRT